MKWYEEKPRRLEKEVSLIRKIYPYARISIVKGYLVVKLRVVGRKTRYLLRVVYPRDFPYEEPKAYIDQPQIEYAKHRWNDGSLCIEGDAEPPALSGKIVMDWAINWIRAFEHWLDTDNWPERIRGQR